VVGHFNRRGRAEQLIKEGKVALNWTRLSCHYFVDNQVRRQRFALAYNLGNFLRRLVFPASVKHWTLATLRNKLIKIRMQGRASRQARGVPVGGGGDPPIPVRYDPPSHRVVEAAGPATPMIHDHCTLRHPESQQPSRYRCAHAR